MNSITVEHLKRAGIEREKLTYEQVYFYPPMMSFAPCEKTCAPIFNTNHAFNRETSLYIHVPFCTGHCTYCHYVTYTGHSTDSIAAYLGALEQEVRLLSKYGWFDNRTSHIVHVGGGTPTFLEPDQITRLIDLIRRIMPLESNVEFTWESSPETIIESKAKKLSLLLKEGINRLSIGIESLEDHVLKICGRRYRADTAIRAYFEARERGFQNINFDMIYGLADQTLDDWKRSLDLVIELGPDCVTAYHLRMKPGTPMASFDLSRFPSEAVCREMQIATFTNLTGAGYFQVMGNQFVREGSKPYRYEVEKWRDSRDIIGIGVSAYSYIDGWAYYNKRSLTEYTKSVLEGQLPIYLERRLSKSQRAARMLVLGLRVVPDGVSKSVFAETFDTPVEEMFKQTIERMEDLGLIEDTAEHIRLTPLGTLFSDEVCLEFYAEEDKEQLRKVQASKYGLYLDCPEHLVKLKRAKTAASARA